MLVAHYIVVERPPFLRVEAQGCLPVGSANCTYLFVLPVFGLVPHRPRSLFLYITVMDLEARVLGPLRIHLLLRQHMRSGQKCEITLL